MRKYLNPNSDIIRYYSDGPTFGKEINPETTDFAHWAFRWYLSFDMKEQFVKAVKASNYLTKKAEPGELDTLSALYWERALDAEEGSDGEDLMKSFDIILAWVREGHDAIRDLADTLTNYRHMDNLLTEPSRSILIPPKQGEVTEAVFYSDAKDGLFVMGNVVYGSGKIHLKRDDNSVETIWADYRTTCGGSDESEYETEVIFPESNIESARNMAAIKQAIEKFWQSQLQLLSARCKLSERKVYDFPVSVEVKSMELRGGDKMQVKAEVSLGEVCELRTFLTTIPDRIFRFEYDDEAVAIIMSKMQMVYIQNSVFDIYPVLTTYLLKTVAEYIIKNLGT